MLLESKLMGGLLHYYMEKVSNKYCDNRSHGHIQAYLNVIILTHKTSHPRLYYNIISLVMRAAANKPNINIVAVNDPFISVDYSKYSVVYMCQQYYIP